LVSSLLAALLTTRRSDFNYIVAAGHVLVDSLVKTRSNLFAIASACFLFHLEIIVAATGIFEFSNSLVYWRW